ncbi:ATP-dependent DNA helicase [Rhodococcus sp. 15-649-1-2]|uniref:ATP-dependent helicase n=1 Tax=Rhodococcus sp. 114MFTsu3.1 TaxID=1172184 RepID=UPI0003638F5F|nr:MULTISPECIES: ATP-dependent DNA helicase [unclassified Rhodococcus (in: high G+C Gram-positive bacteria)]OZC79854.1 ATP-dependent DNA helicase [Rhodococcus sp. 06-418-1B]OZE88101.1 ATP-dependent DNA helicase [Rhodococcus sp. 15-649-1-2]
MSSDSRSGTHHGGRHAAAATLVRAPKVAVPPRTWTGSAAHMLAGRTDAVSAAVDGAPAWQPWQVIGGPGTGKSSLVADYAVSRIVAGDPEAVLVLTQSKRAATAMRQQITGGLFAGEHAVRATREPLVRTVHSYAFAVLRLQAAIHGNPPPRLLTGAEQDAVVREMLRGDLEDGAQDWPDRLRPALGMAGFVTAVRDLMLRSAERGIGPEDLVKLGRKHARPEWMAVGKFAARYEQAMLLRGAVGVEAAGASAPGLDAAELIGSALMAFATDPDLLHSERARIRHLVVDDAQHLDPQAAQLVRLIGSRTESTVIAGDPDQSVFTFRGADPSFLADLADAGSERHVMLDRNFRSAPAVAAVTARISGRLPGIGRHRAPEAVASAQYGDARALVQVLPSAAKEAALIADTMRRAHLVDGMPWSAMAVVVRSVPRVIAPLRRALQAAGVPILTPASELPLHRQHGAVGLLLVVRALVDPTFDGEDALALLSGPVGGADPVALRRLRRGVRRVELASGGERDSAELLRQAITGVRSHSGSDPAPETDRSRWMAQLSDVEAAPLRRVLGVVRKANAVARRGRGVEDVLWAAWQASGLERRWSAASARGGSAGAQADRDLDAVVALFDSAAAYVDRLPQARLAGFVEYISQQQIPTSNGMAGAVPKDAVTVLSAHSAAGREWNLVAVAGVQEGLWPGLRARGSLLGTESLVDLASGVADDVTSDGTLSKTAPLLADERRLFLVACSRARSTLLVTAVDSSTGDTDLVRSRFLDELRGNEDADELEQVPEVPQPAARVLALPMLVAELRRVVCDADVAEHDPQKHARAARQLARLADAGVKGAHPREWFGVAGTSTDAPLWTLGDGPVPLSPSTVEQLTTCPLRWMLDRHGGNDGANTHAVTGTLVHTLVQAVAGKMPPEQVRRALETAWDAVDLGSQWFSRHELDRTGAMLDTFERWLSGTRGELTEAGVEVAVDGVLPARTDDEPSVALRGRIDRLEHDPDGRPVIIDVKTAKTVMSKEDARSHNQLATYQVAAAAGAIEGEPAGEPGGARLVFVAKPHKQDGATQRIQEAPTPEKLAEWRDTVHAAASATQGPYFEAFVNDGCRHCPVKSSCPAQETGRQVTES